jgi:hypothetical protein
MNIELIRHLAKEYDKGSRDPEAILANACLEAYERGFDDGSHDAEERIAQTQMLLMFTAGNA